MHIKPDNIIFNKAAIIERALKSMREEYLKDKDLTNYTYIDAMTGFRNIAIHEYQELAMPILKDIAAKNFTSLIEYCKEVGVNIEVK